MRKAVFLLFLISLSFDVCAQDTQYSQYYNSPLYLNPAFAGAGLDTRIGLHYRNQWRGLNDGFTSFSAWGDHDFYKRKSGVGFFIKRDAQGATKLRSTEINVQYAYQLNVSRSWTVKPALQLGMGIRDVNFGQSVFGDQLANDGLTGNATNDALAGVANSYLYPDISAGTIAYNSNLWLGFSAHHINRPNQSFGRQEQLPLPIKWSILGGYKILLQERQIAWGAPVKETSITPTFLYKAQGGYDQLDMGVYFIHDPLMVGAWYRGLPFKQYQKGITNAESLVLMAGFHQHNLTIGYSYDIVISRLAGNSGGAHELSLIYQWQTDKSNRKGKKGHRPMPCPNVDRQYKKSNF